MSGCKEHGLQALTAVFRDRCYLPRPTSHGPGLWSCKGDPDLKHMWRVSFVSPSRLLDLTGVDRLSVQRQCLVWRIRFAWLSPQSLRARQLVPWHYDRYHCMGRRCWKPACMALFSFICLLSHDNLLIKHFPWLCYLHGLQPVRPQFNLFHPLFMGNVRCTAAFNIVLRSESSTPRSPLCIGTQGLSLFNCRTN